MVHKALSLLNLMIFMQTLHHRMPVMFDRAAVDQWLDPQASPTDIDHLLQAAAAPELLEPLMELEIITPSDFMGDVMGDLNGRRGRVLGMDSQGKYQVIKANVPMAEVLQYALDLNSISGGRGTFKMEHSHYEEVPTQLAEKVIAAAKEKQ